MPKKLLFIVNTPDFFLSHRLPIALAAKEQGYKIIIATASSNASVEIEHHGFEWRQVSFSRSGTSIFNEISTLYSLYILFKQFKPDIVHLVTIKPVLYGGAISRILQVPTVFAVSGLGTVFSDPKSGWLLTNIVKKLYRFVFQRKRLAVIFQNEFDMQTLCSISNVDKNACNLIHGSGVNLQSFHVVSEPESNIVVVMASRLILEKGVREFIAAAKIVSEKMPDIKFLLCGSIDVGNPNHLQQYELDLLNDELNVDYMGEQQNITEVFQKSHIVVLPSYYGEGLPKVLIEAAACGRAVITTDHPGCRDAIINGKTGLLVTPRDPEAIALAIMDLAKNHEKRKEMGRQGRVLAFERFDIKLVVDKHLAIYQSLCS